MKGLSRGTFINALLVISLAILASSVIIAYQQIQRLVNSEDWVVHTHEVIQILSEVLFSATLVDSKVRDYLITQDKNSIKNVPTFIEIINKDMTHLQQLMRNSPSQLSKLNKLSPLIDNKLNLLQQTLSAYSQGGKQVAVSVTLYNNSQSQNQDILQLITNMSREELYFLDKRNAISKYNAKRSSLMVIISGSVGGILLLLSFILLNYHLSERIRTEHEKQELENRLKIIIDGSTDLIAALDLNFNFIAYNTAYEKKFMEFYGKKITVGTNLQDALSQYPNKDEVIEIWQRALMGEKFTIVNKYETLDKRIQFYEATYSIIRNAAGHRIGAAHIMRDITERERVDQLKAEFVSIVSHELRTPLTSLRGSLGLILGGMTGKLDEKTKSMLSIAYSNCERLVGLINDILDIEKIETNEIEFQLTLIDINKFAQEAIEINQPRSEDFDVKLNLIKADKTIYVKADYNRLMQVLTNLIENAMRFSPLGGRVDVSVSIYDELVRVAVTDHGQGVPEEFRKHLFEKFSQADLSTIRKHGGSGLGLNISKTIISKLNGNLNYQSIPDVGSTFYFELPISHEFS